MAIRVETSKRNRIENFQDHDIPAMDLLWCKKLSKLHPNAVKRTDPSPIFNCHGLTFASRRTKILNRKNVQLILDDDGWKEVTLAEVSPGDIIVYFDDSGDPSHSGLVVSADAGLTVPRIMSKWGVAGEYIHLASDVPSIYGSTQKYFRCTL